MFGNFLRTLRGIFARTPSKKFLQKFIILLEKSSDVQYNFYRFAKVYHCQTILCDVNVGKPSWVNFFAPSKIYFNLPQSK